MGENSAAWGVEWPRLVFGVKIHYIICPLFHNHWLAWFALAGETLWAGESATIRSQVTNELVGSNTTYVMLLYLGCIRKPSGIYSV